MGTKGSAQDWCERSKLSPTPSPPDTRVRHPQVEPQNTSLPQGYDDKLTPFEKVMLMGILRPDKLVPAIQVGALTLTFEDG